MQTLPHYRSGTPPVHPAPDPDEHQGREKLPCVRGILGHPSSSQEGSSNNNLYCPMKPSSEEAERSQDQPERAVILNGRQLPLPAPPTPPTSQVVIGSTPLDTPRFFLYRNYPYTRLTYELPVFGDPGDIPLTAPEDEGEDVPGDIGGWDDGQSEKESSASDCSTLTECPDEQSDYLPGDSSDEDETLSKPSARALKGSAEDSGTNTEGTISCEFAGTCHMGSGSEQTHYRKIISHIFGRNKSATKVFPNNVWVHYCRKHYQRARYRAGQWPFTQCDLLLESLSRMEEWGGVESFQLILRRREQERLHNTATQDGNGNNSRQASRAVSRAAAGSTSNGSMRNVGRRNPCAVIAPVPNWLRDRAGSGLTFGDIREIIRQIRGHMEEIQDGDPSEEEEEEKEKEKKEPNAPGPSSSSAAKKKGRRTSTKRAPAPTPRSPIRFPDIEIIPTFKKWAMDQHTAQRQQKKGDKDGSNASQNVQGGSASTGSPSAASNARTRPSRRQQPSNAAQGSSSLPIAWSARKLRPVSTGNRTRINARGGVKRPHRKM